MSARKWASGLQMEIIGNCMDGLSVIPSLLEIDSSRTGASIDGRGI